MAAEDFIHDLSSYLSDGSLSDLTLKFGEKSWQIHKAIACSHSKWFRKAVTIGFEESQSGVITLNDDPDFADAIDCMVSYFYDAGYNISQYDTSGSLLHAQIATIADKYDCASLYKLAKSLFADTVKAIEIDDWIVVAAFVYDHTTTNLPAHKELRGLVVASLADRPVVLRMVLQQENIAELLRYTADLATDLLLSRPYVFKIEDGAKQTFTCGKCQYVHVGSHDCAYVACEISFVHGNTCPQCGNESGYTSKRHSYRVGLVESFSCPFCDGIHTVQLEKL